MKSASKGITIPFFLLVFFSFSMAWASSDLATKHCGLYAYSAIVTEVYDGDTITADVDLGFKTWRHGEKLRLFGIDAPEVRGEERPEGLKSRDALRERILNKDVIICTIKDKTGKFGRYLAEIYLDDENINQWLIENNHAQPYEGAVRATMFEIPSLFGEQFEYAPLPLN